MLLARRVQYTRPPLGAVRPLERTEALPKRPPGGGTSTNGSVGMSSEGTRDSSITS